MKTQDEIGTVKVDSIAMRKEYLLKELKRLNFPASYSVCCDQCWNITRVQKRTLTKKYVQYLIVLRDMIKNTDQEYVHHTEIQRRCYDIYKTNVSDYALLKNLSLIEDNCQTEGYFRVSKKGYDFIQDKIRIPRAYYQIPNSLDFIYSTKTVGFFDVMTDLKNNIKN